MVGNFRTNQEYKGTVVNPDGSGGKERIRSVDFSEGSELGEVEAKHLACNFPQQCAGDCPNQNDMPLLPLVGHEAEDDVEQKQ